MSTIAALEPRPPLFPPVVQDQRHPHQQHRQEVGKLEDVGDVRAELDRLGYYCLTTRRR